MRFVVLRGDILEAVQKVQYSASGKGIMPILSGVKIECEEGRLVVSATDLESYTVSQCTASVEEAGSCVVNLKTLQDYLRDSGAEKLSMTYLGNELEIEGGKSNIRLFTMPVEDFPQQPTVDIAVVEGLDAKSFFSAVHKVSKAASRDDKRPTLTGVFMEIREDLIRLVSTDSYRLALEEIRGGFAVREEGEYIIPATALVNLARAAGKDGSLEVKRDENRGQLRFDVNGIINVIRQIEGKFPKYGQFIPEETRILIEADRKELIEALKRISLISSTVKMSARPGILILEGESRDVGEGKEEVETVHQGEEINIAFNASFLEDGLQALEGEKALIGVNESLKPGMLKEKEENGFRYVIMPIRL